MQCTYQEYIPLRASVKSFMHASPEKDCQSSGPSPTAHWRKIRLQLGGACYLRGKAMVADSHN